ncbi:YiiX/YebB-like N1pC/P60 family cysteine hydrolase [Winogradskyella forsetii]|uniref:YiiX/YebB-like N1pC/P60 family cysteine hydrolase n=1 Tax=Winogradskyella forsetii TaxID=2686077 RepID=UPI0015B7C87F|nr:YiiX/YebB-like N1pC/P60 family cysteine hydrolase [Winogradskyella forsetii]
MYIINFSKLRVGDILLTRKHDRECKLIRKLTNSDYSHAILYVGVGSGIESNGLGVQSINTTRTIYKFPNDVQILRYNKSNFEHIMEDVINFARQKIGTEYSTKEARLAKLEENIEAKETNRQFCTRFVAQSYKNAGIIVVPNPDYCSPKELMESDYFDLIDSCLEKGTKEQIDYANEKDNPISQQTDITNEIFEFARSISNTDIQTFEQLSKYVLENRTKEPEITEFIRSSGYLTMWKKDIERNPWYYDYQKALEHYKSSEERKGNGKFFSDTEEYTRHRFLVSLDAMKYGYSFFKQDFFKDQIELCEKLIELSNQRESVGNKLLSE